MLLDLAAMHFNLCSDLIEVRFEVQWRILAELNGDAMNCIEANCELMNRVGPLLVCHVSPNYRICGRQGPVIHPIEVSGRSPQRDDNSRV